MRMLIMSAQMYERFHTNIENKFKFKFKKIYPIRTDGSRVRSDILTYLRFSLVVGNANGGWI